MYEVGAEWPLFSKKTFVENKLMIAYKASETLHETLPRSESSPGKSKSGCYNCGQHGHFAADCPKGRRAHSQPPPRTHRDHRENSSKPPGGNYSRGSGPPRGRPTYKGHHKGGGGHEVSKGNQKPLPLSRDEVQRRRDQNLCLRCGKPGHIAKDCPVGNSLPDRKSSSQRQVTSSFAQDHSGKAKGKGRGKGKAKGKGRGKPQPRGGKAGVRAVDGDFDEEYYEEESFVEDEEFCDDDVCIPVGTA